MKRSKVFRHVSSLATLVAVAFILAACGPAAQDVSPTRSTAGLSTATQAPNPSTTAAPTVTALPAQTRVVLAEMFTGDW